jgi:hypothetical protein
MTDSVMIVRLPFILFWLLTSTCVIGAKQHGIKDVGPSLPALVSYDTIHKAFNDESSNVYLAQTHDLHTSADQKHLSNSAEFNKIAAKQSPIPFLAYCVATNKASGRFYRYVGEGEAAAIRRSGEIPNVDRLGNSKDVYFTDRLYQTAGRAKTYNQLPSKPAYRIEIDPANVSNRSPFTRVNQEIIHNGVLEVESKRPQETRYQLIRLH